MYIATWPSPISTSWHLSKLHRTDLRCLPCLCDAIPSMPLIPRYLLSCQFFSSVFNVWITCNPLLCSCCCLLFGYQLSIFYLLFLLQFVFFIVFFLVFCSLLFCSVLFCFDMVFFGFETPKVKKSSQFFNDCAQKSMFFPNYSTPFNC